MISAPWWKTTTIYQIYPRSYCDSNRDGIGDIVGIISKLDYICDLGFETIWLSPFFKSPQKDWGYDISDYYSIDPSYGDMNDVEDLIQEIHDRGMKVIFDLVLNHTSDQHSWFLKSRMSRNNPKRDWYIWKDGRGSRPPNNWKSIPGGSGWHYDEKTQQWYYASFLPFQPDLNFHNPVVKQTMFDVARFWLEKGVDGFRLDIFRSIYKDDLFRDNPLSIRFAPTEYFTEGWFQKWVYNQNRPETFKLARDLRALVKSIRPEGLLLGEVFGDDQILREYIGDELDGLNLVFLWDLIKFQVDTEYLRKVILHYEVEFPEPYTPVYVFGNHDQMRTMSRIGGDIKLAKLLALYQLTVRGVPVVYYGEEIGMQDVKIPNAESKDPIAQKYAWIPELIIDLIGIYPNRDRCRSPMQWDQSSNSGFCDEDILPWLPVHESHKSVNVSDELSDPASILNVYRKLLELRKRYPPLQSGRICQITDTPIGKNVLAYSRVKGDDTILVLINLGSSEHVFRNDTECRNLIYEINKELAGSGDVIILPSLSGVILSN